MLRRISLFSLLGSKVKVDISWLLLGFLIAWTMAVAMFPARYPGLTPQAYWLMGIASAVGALISIVFHEFSHALITNYYGLPVKSITLFIFGGVAEMEQAPVNPKTELLMASSGPLASFILALCFYGLLLLSIATGLPLVIIAMLRFMVFINGFLAVFNLIPAFPLDGGRMLRALVWRKTNNLNSATRMSSRIGSGFGLVLMILAIVSLFHGNFVTGLWWFLIGAYLRAAAGASYKQLLIREIVRGKPVRQFMERHPVVITTSMNVQYVANRYLSNRNVKTFPVVQDGKLVGCIRADDIRAIPKSKWAQTNLLDLVSACPHNADISPNTDTGSILTDMVKGNADTPYMVVDRGRLVGVISLKGMRETIAHYLEGTHQ